jgi:hypothetical protein
MPARAGAPELESADIVASIGATIDGDAAQPNTARRMTP